MTQNIAQNTKLVIGYDQYITGLEPIGTGSVLTQFFFNSFIPAPFQQAHT